MLSQHLVPERAGQVLGDSGSRPLQLRTRPRVLGWPWSISGQNPHWGLSVLGFYFSILKMVLSEISGQTFKGQNSI